jgi:hypothetical protein
MRPIGFSTGALAYADFQRGLSMAGEVRCEAVELSALRQDELWPLLHALSTLDLSSFSYVSLHAPSQIAPDREAIVWEALHRECWRGWPIIVHPDSLSDFSLWRELGASLCVENMDKRKLCGRTAKELDRIFSALPDASLCFDIGHARQVDPTMTEAYLILKQFGSQLRQVHISEVNNASKHDPLSFSSILAFQEVAHLIREHVPVILETPVGLAGMNAQMAKAREALPILNRTEVVAPVPS